MAKDRKSKTKSIGRPSDLPAPRESWVTIRVSQEEREAFERAAREDDRDVSGWLRHLARKAVGLRG